MGVKINSVTLPVSSPPVEAIANGFTKNRDFRRKNMLFRIGAGLSALCLAVQCFRDQGFFAKASVGGQRSEPKTESVQTEAPIAVELERLLREDDSLTGESALQIGASNLGLLGDSLDFDAISRHARMLEGEADSTTREDWQERATLYRVIGEFHLCAARGNPMLLERAGDAFVAAGDTLRLYGEAEVAQQRYRRAIEALTLALNAIPSTRSEAVGRMRGKIATLETNIEVLRKRIERSSSQEASE
jgi:hypothetical protein